MSLRFSEASRQRLKLRFSEDLLVTSARCRKYEGFPRQKKQASTRRLLAMAIAAIKLGMLSGNSPNPHACGRDRFMAATVNSTGLMTATRSTSEWTNLENVKFAFDPQQQPEFLHLWAGFYYGEMAATALSERLAEMAPDRQLQRFSAETHHQDEQWHADVFRTLVHQFPGSSEMPAAPDWALDISEKVRTCNSYVELTIGSLVVEASAVFLLDLQTGFSGELGYTFRRMLLQEKGHVAFATQYLREHFQTANAEERHQFRTLLLDTFRYMRDRIRPAFVELHLNPVLPFLGISAQDYRERARMASRSVLRSILR